MAGRRYADDVSIDRYDERRDYTSRNGRRVYEDRFVDEEVDYRRGTPVRERERERDITVRDDVRERPRSGLDWLQDGYGRTSAGAVVLAKREREDFEFVPRLRRRSPSPEPERKIEKEEIIVRKRDESTSRPPPRIRERDRAFDREEVIIRRDERDGDRRLPPPTRDRERDEIIFRRDERERLPPAREQNTSREEIVIRRGDEGGRVRYDADYDRDDVVSRRGDYARSVRGDVERDEVIIRREEQNLSPRGYDDYPLSRPKSHERARSRARRSSSASNQEIIIRQEEREGRGGTRDRQEIIIRKNSRSRSPSTSVTSAPAGPPPPQVINAPTIHQEVITHHRHIDHGFEVAIPSRPRAISRPPSPPSPPPPPAPAPRARSEERIQISRTQTRNGHTSAEDIIIDRNEGPTGSRPVAPYVPPPRDPYYDPAPPRRDYGYDRDIQEEAEYYNSRAVERSYVGEGYRGATRDWAIVDVPPGTRRVRMDGAGGGSQEITWQRYNGVRRSKFMPDGVPDDAYPSEVGRPAPLPAPAPAPLPASNGEIGRRYGRERDPTDGLWTEITKDLVVKEAIQEMGYEFEETDDFYYIIAYLRYEDIARLVGLSEDIRKERRKRAKELEWENRVLPPPVVEEVTRPLLIEPPPRSRQPWDREEERYIEREIVYKGGRPPPPVAWRR
ncbi:hypothetical protein A1O3_07971 [Capronia epimyces CBS 606.96]|uniref:DUF8035 domain-containing protein n=1 Tax=Capronia epimyces CBS 606.96 TaxID=1182542 RepID=W9XQS8_9EURO|nr:uncharacterized protein A1O3_07971 [Capronia epimyces CBS 606.96]EXJ79690.1 hypothetical protein A1O3_07971 [Capronia epimyces CBS 606.96]